MWKVKLPLVVRLAPTTTEDVISLSMILLILRLVLSSCLMASSLLPREGMTQGDLKEA